MLLAVKTTSGLFIEEEMTPEKRNRFGFQEAPLTPVNKTFKIEKIYKMPITQINGGKAKKRRSLHLEEQPLLLPKPKWYIDNDSEVDNKQKSKRKKLNFGSTDVIVQSLNSTRRKKTAIGLLPVELVEYRKQNLYRKGVPRQDATSLLREKQRRLAGRK